MEIAAHIAQSGNGILPHRDVLLISGKAKITGKLFT
jgi:hypothetical protein